MRFHPDSQVELANGAVLKWATLEQSDLWNSVLHESSQLQRFDALRYQAGRAASLPAWLGLNQVSQRLILSRQFLPGRTLREISRMGPLPPKRVERWIGALAELLAKIHAQNEAHGDLSAANVLLTPAGELVLLDWGTDQRRTPAYVSPERSISPAADVYSLGILWCQLISGRLDSQPPQGLAGACLDRNPDERPGALEIGRALSDRNLFRHCLGRESLRANVLRSWALLDQGRSIWLGLPAPSGIGKSEMLRELTSELWPSAWGQGSASSSPQARAVFQGLMHAPILEDLAQGLRTPTGPMHLRNLSQQWFAILSEAAERHGRLLLVIDDAQWLNESSYQLLAELSHNNIPGLMVILSWREDEWKPPPGLRLDGLLPLASLSAADLQVWLKRDGLQHSTLEIEELAHWSQGSPLLLRYWLDGSGHSLSASRVRALLEQRIDSLPLDQRSVLQAAALLGKTFSLTPLTYLFGALVPHSIEAALHLQLIRKDADELYQFSHDRVRELCTPEESQARHFHSRLAQYFLELEDPAPSACAYHLAESGDRRRAAPIALVAARQQLKRGAFDGARQFYEIHLSQDHDLDVWIEYSQALEGLNQTRLAQLKLLSVYQRAEGDKQLLAFLERISELSYNLCDYSRQMEFSRKCSKIWNVRAQGMGIYYRMAAAFHLEQQKTLMQTFPVLLAYASLVHNELPIIQANALSGLCHLGLAPWLGRWIRKVVAACDKGRDPAEWAAVISRVSVHRFGDSRPDGHLQLLREVEPVFENYSNSHELFMCYLQLGMYAGPAGRFQELQRLSQKLLALARQSGNPAALDTGLLFEVEAHGGIVDLAIFRPCLEGGKRPMLGFLRAMVGLAQVHLRRGQPQLALEALERTTNVNAGVDRAMIECWRATAARSAMEMTPRSQAKRRKKLWQTAWNSAEKCLKLRNAARLYTFQALRERAWLQLAQGSLQLARQDFAASSQEAQEYGATYQEALSRLAWGRVGRSLDWQEAESQWNQGRELLYQLGAWWDLQADESSALPLEELSEAAQDYLEGRKEPLIALGSKDMVEALDTLLRQERESLARVQSESQRLQQENTMWEAFLRNGPVRYERRDAQGQVVEGNLTSPGPEARCLTLSDQTQVRIEMPTQRWSFDQLEELIEREQELLRCQLDEDWRRAGPAREDLETEWRLLMTDQGREWPTEFEQALPLLQHLDAFSRQILLGVLREISNNSRKHGEGPMQSEFSWNQGFLSIHFQQARRSKGDPGEAGFGLETMRFRLEQVGGQLATRVTEDCFYLSIRMAGRIRAPLEP